MKQKPRSVCILVDDYLPASTKVAAKMMHEMAIEFVRRGVPATVITPSSDIQTGFSRDILDGVRIYRFKSGRLKNTSRFLRAIREITLSYRARWRLRSVFKTEPYDLLIYFTPTIFWGPLVLFLKAQWNCFTYQVLRDFFPQWAIDQGLLRERSIISSIFRWYEKINHRAADMIGIQPAGNLEVFARLHPQRYPAQLLYNWTSSTMVKPSAGFPNRKKLGLMKKIVFFYGGNIGPAQGIENLVELMRRFKTKPEVHFLFVGSGESVASLLEAKNRLQLENLSYMKPVDQKDFSALQSEFDIGLFSLDSAHTTHNIPGKILGYLSSGMPLLGCVNKGNDLKDIINHGGAGFVSWSGDADELAANATKIISKPVRSRLSKSALQLKAKIFSVEGAVDTITAAYQVH